MSKTYLVTIDNDNVTELQVMKALQKLNSLVTMKDLSADEIELMSEGLEAWMGEFKTSGEDWSDVRALVDKLRRTATPAP